MTWDLESYGTLKQEKIKTMAKLVGMSQAPNGLSRQLDVSTLQQQGAILRSTYHRKQQRKKFPKTHICKP